MPFAAIRSNDSLSPRRTIGLILTVFVLWGFGCGGHAASEPTAEPSGPAILFIGNSYTYVNDVPGIVQAMADSSGRGPLVVKMVAYPDFALVDHWKDGTATREIRKGAWRFVVLQQGPSSTDVNRDSLRLLTAAFATEIEKVGGRPALFSAWPTASRRQDFARAIESYQLAAADVRGIYLPVAPAWLAAWDRDPSLKLQSDDGIHATVAGSYLSSLVIYATLLQATPVGLPARLRLRDGTIVTIDPALATSLQEAARLATSR